MTYESSGLATTLEQFVAVAETGSVTAAASRLDVPQPTVSRTIARLARELGTDLLVRDGRGIRLTRQGQVLAEHCSKALQEIRDGVTAVRSDASADTGHVVLGFLHSMGPRAVPELLRGFRDAHPDVSVGLVQSSAEDVLDGVLGGRVDLALASPVPDRPELRSRALARQPLVAVVPPRHRLAARHRVSVDELTREQLITMRAGYGVRTLTDALLREAGKPLTYAFESDEMTTIAGLVEAGLGVSVLPRGAAGGTAAVEISLTGTGATRVISLVWSTRRTQTAPVVALRQHLIEHGTVALSNAGPATDGTLRRR